MPRGRPPLPIAIGQRFSLLTVVKEDLAGNKRNLRRFLCRCDCGRQAVVRVGRLVHGETTSCGCVKMRKRTHGETIGALNLPTPEYQAWQQMKQRCLNPRHRAFKGYGGRGVTVCAAWSTSFSNFLHDVGRRPSPIHSIDRFPNNDGNYEPGNVRWATRMQQAQNRRGTRWLTRDGETFPLHEWARRCGIPASTLWDRLNRQWPLHLALIP